MGPQTYFAKGQTPVQLLKLEPGGTSAINHTRAVVGQGGEQESKGTCDRGRGKRAEKWGIREYTP